MRAPDRQLRGLGLTVAEIRELTSDYLTGKAEPIGPRLAELLHHARTRLTARIGELQQTLHRIDEFEATHHRELTGHGGTCWPMIPAAP